MKWYIGQRIVAIQDHSKGKFKKGSEFVVHGIRDSFCKCDMYELNIGFSSDSPLINCRICNLTTQGDGIHWFSEMLFAPLEEKPEMSAYTAEELIEELGQQTITI